jgi:hypothetical protein
MIKMWLPPGHCAAHSKQRNEASGLLTSSFTRSMVFGVGWYAQIKQGSFFLGPKTTAPTNNVGVNVVGRNVSGNALNWDCHRMEGIYGKHTRETSSVL